MFDFLKKKITSWLGKKSDEEEKPKEKAKKTLPKKKKEEKPIKSSAKKETSKKTVKKEATENKEKKTDSKVEEDIEFFGDSEDQSNEIVLEAKKEELVPEVEEKIEIEEPIKQTNEEGNFFTRLVKKITDSKLTKEEFEEIFSDLEITLLENNVALEAVDAIKEYLSSHLVGHQMKKSEAQSKIVESLKNSILSLLIEPPDIIEQIKEKEGIFTIVFFGINGTGKTTSIAKLAHLLKKEGISCILAAADTFRAASIEQLKTHANKIEVPIISHQYNADPAAVAFDAKKYAQTHNIKVVLIDTAGRMYTKENLLKEMEKIIRISKPDLKFFVGESITGNDAIDQAKTFNEAIGIDGIILSKADVDEKAGTILSVSHITHKPIYFLGVGQDYKDLQVFTKKTVLKNLGLE